MSWREGMRSRPGGLPGGGRPELGPKQDGSWMQSGSGIQQAAGTAWTKAQGHECARDLCPGSLPQAPPPPLRHSAQPRPLPLSTAPPQLPLSTAPPTTAAPLRAHLLQRPWERCALLPMDVGREHFWHMHSFPLKVTRSPGGKGNLKQDNELQARTTRCSSGGGGKGRPRPITFRWDLTEGCLRPRTRGLSVQGLPRPRRVTSG